MVKNVNWLVKYSFLLEKNVKNKVVGMPKISDNQIKRIFSRNLRRIMDSRNLDGAALARMLGTRGRKTIRLTRSGSRL